MMLHRLAAGRILPGPLIIMPAQTSVVRAKGQVTIPRKIRNKLNLKQGDRVVFIETGKGVVIQSARVVVTMALKEIGEELKKRGVSLDRLIEAGREIRDELIEEEYGS